MPLHRRHVALVGAAEGTMKAVGGIKVSEDASCGLRGGELMSAVLDDLPRALRKRAPTHSKSVSTNIQPPPVVADDYTEGRMGDGARKLRRMRQGMRRQLLAELNRWRQRAWRPSRASPDTTS